MPSFDASSRPGSSSVPDNDIHQVNDDEDAEMHFDISRSNVSSPCRKKRSKNSGDDSETKVKKRKVKNRISSDDEDD